MAYQAGGQRPVPRPVPETPEAQAYLQDYAALLEAVPSRPSSSTTAGTSSLTNTAFRSLFGGVGPHPTAMPGDNFLRFVLFHPDAATVLGEHESSWCLPMLAHFARRRGAPRPRPRACRPSAVTSPRTRSWRPPTGRACRTGSARSARRPSSTTAPYARCCTPTRAGAPPSAGSSSRRQDARGAGLHPVDARAARGPPPSASAQDRARRAVPPGHLSVVPAPEV